MKGKNVFIGLIFIFVALMVLLNGLSLMPSIPVIRIAISCFLLVLCISELTKGHFFLPCVSLGLIGCIFDSELGIEMITPWTLMVVCALLGLGLEVIFKKETECNQGINQTYDYVYDEKNKQTVEETIKDDVVFVKNSFNESSKYIETTGLKKAIVSNAFGKLSVYFQGASVSVEGAYIKSTNAFGETNIYVPKTWRVLVKQNNTLGAIRVYGQSEAEPGAPEVVISAENSFGDLSISYI